MTVWERYKRITWKYGYPYSIRCRPSFLHSYLIVVNSYLRCEIFFSTSSSIRVQISTKKWNYVHDRCRTCFYCHYLYHTFCLHCLSVLTNGFQNDDFFEYDVMKRENLGKTSENFLNINIKTWKHVHDSNPWL